MHNIYIYIVYKYNFRWFLVFRNDACDFHALLISHRDDSDKNILSFCARLPLTNKSD